MEVISRMIKEEDQRKGRVGSGNDFFVRPVGMNLRRERLDMILFSRKLLIILLSWIVQILKKCLFSLILYTLIHQIYTHVYVLLKYDQLRLDGFQVKPLNGKNFTVFMTIKDRHEYLSTMDSFVRRVSHDVGEFHVYDFGSTPELTLPTEYAFDRRVKLIRFEEYVNQPFLFWNALSKSLANIETEYVLYVDNCNILPRHFRYETYLKRGENFFFPNVERRFYSGNFFTKRSSLLNFLRDSPIHLVGRKEAFYGSDQLLVWYFDMRKGTKLGHLPHLTTAKIDGYSSSNILGMRIFLYMNYYGQKVSNKYGAFQRKYWCWDKKILCKWNGLLIRVLRLPIIYHVIDSMMSLDWLWWPMIFVANIYHVWIAGSVLSLLLALSFFGFVWTIFIHIIRITSLISFIRRRKRSVNNFSSRKKV